MSEDNKNIIFQYLKDLTVLYVEDDENIKKMVEFFLGKNIKTLYSASDGAEGLESFKKNKPDLIITDVQMPNMTGIEMATLIRKMDAEIPIIILTAYNDSEFLFEAMSLGITNYLTKPLDLRILMQTIGKITQNLNLKKENENIRNILEQYKDIVDESSLISKINLHGKITYINKHYEEVSGYSPDELIGKEFSFVEDLTTSKRSFFEILEQIKNDKNIWHGVLKNTNKNGSHYFVDSTIKPILDLENNVEEFIVLSHDITDSETTKEYFKEQNNIKSHDLQDAIRISKEYEEAINQSNIFIRVGKDRRIKYVNDLFYSTYGYTKDELIGKPHSWLNHPDLPFSFYQNMWELIESGRIWKGKLITKSKSNKDMYSNATFVPLKNINGEIIEYLGIRHDITQTVELHTELEDTQRELIYRMGEIGETRSLETGNHVKRVAEYSKLLAQKVGLDMNETNTLFMASPMHDIGKVGIPDAILNKPGKHTPDEWEIMKTHSEIGYNILKSSKRPILKAAAIVSYTHHEKWDGSGYPKGLKEENIHIFGRITAIADVFDALGSDRVYKKAWDLDKILDLFHEQRGIHFDPKLVDLFMDHLDEFLAIRDIYQDKVV